MEQLSETSELRTNLCQRRVIKMKFKKKISLQTTPIRFTIEESADF